MVKGALIMKIKTAIALGTFDGVHKGHLAVLKLPHDYYKVAVTFEYPPKVYFADKKELLMSATDKKESLRQLGIDEILLLDFSLVKDMSAEDFLEFIYDKYKPALISCGFNYKFGKKGSGNIELIKSFCEKNNIDFDCQPPVEADGNAISSTNIRELLRNGKVESAATLLNKPFSFVAEVIHGDRRGRTIGFPTINQKYPEDLVKLKFGVYKTKIGFDGKEYSGITNIGIRPTFETDFTICETYIKDFSGDIYGKTVRITPIEFLREEIKFDSVQELKEQIKIDINR